MLSPLWDEHQLLAFNLVPTTWQVWFVNSRRVLIADLRAARWIRGGLWTLAVLWGTSLFTLFALFTPKYYNAVTVGFTGYPEGCQPNDAFSIDPSGYNPFAIDDYFQINIGFGELSFTQAKVIDMAWDVIAGRVGQAVLGFYTWKSFATHVKYSMHRRPVTYGTFWTAFMDDQPSFWGTLQFIRDGTIKRTGQAKAIIVFFAAAMLLVLAFPTMASAMTGYRANSGAFVMDRRNNMMALKSFTAVAYIIHDGSRINRTDHYVTAFESWKDWSFAARETPDIFAPYSCSQDETCLFAQSISNYVKTYGFFGLDRGVLNDRETQFGGRTLPKPALNISAFYIPQHEFWYGNNWTDPVTLLRPFSELSSARFFVREGKTDDLYSLDDIQKRGSCQALESYQWGFSFLQVLVACALLLVWTLGIYLIWLKAHLSLLQRVDAKVPTKYEAALMLAAEINSSLEGNGKSSTDEKSIDDRISQDIKGGRISIAETADVTSIGLLAYLWKWITNNMWWFLALLILTPYCALGWTHSPVALYVAGTILEGFVIIALAVGTTQGSRLLLLTCGMVLAFWGAVIALATGNQWLCYFELVRSSRSYCSSIYL